MFTIELESKDNVKNVSLNNDDKVIIEGSLGTFQKAHFVEDLVLVVIGSAGELRVDLAMKDLDMQSCGEKGLKNGRGE